MRYRKSVKLAKGVKVNFSKSGASFTTGIPGFSFTTGRKGAYVNTGIPGTGVYNRTKIGGDSKGGSTSSESISKSHKKAAGTSIKLILDDNGVMSFAYDDGRPITDESLIRKIKATPQYKIEKERMQLEHKSDMANKVAEYNNSINSLINIQHLSANVDSREAFNKELSELKLLKYSRVPFEVKKPSIEDIHKELETEANKSIKSAAFWSLKRKREEYITKNLDDRYSINLAKWEQQRTEFENQQLEIEKKQNIELEQEYNSRKSALEAAISGDDCYINIAIEEWLAGIELPVDCCAQFTYNSATQSLYIDLDLPEIENMPSEKAIQLASGNMKLTKKPQNEIKDNYCTCVFGLAVFFASHLFNISPTIQQIIISGFTQKRDSKGEENDIYIYSIKFSRDIFETSDIVSVNPYDFCMRFENRCLLTQTKTFKKVEPYELGE